MKNLIPFIAAAALAAPGISHAETAFSKPSGYVTQELAANTLNLVGVTLHSAPIASGNLELTSGFGNVITDNEATFVVAAGRRYILEITSGALKGSVQDIASSDISAKSITLSQNVESMGLANGDTYQLRLAPTIEEVFQVGTSTVLKSSLGSSNADIVWISDGNGGFEKYYVANGDVVRRVNDNALAPDVPVIYTDGILVQKRATSSSLVLTGQVKTSSSVSPVKFGFNLVSVVIPTGATLKTIGLEDDLKSSLSSSNADIVWVPQAGGSYAKYYRASGGVWRDVSTNNDLGASEDVNLPSAIFIQRKTPSDGRIGLEVPSYVSDL